MNYFKDKVEPNKKYKVPNENEKKALINLAKKLELVLQETKLNFEKKLTLSP